LSHQEKQDYIQKIKHYFEQYQAFTADVHEAMPKTTELSYNNELLLKGLVLSHARDMREAIRQKADSALMATYEEWKRLKTVIARQYSRPKGKRSASLDSLEKQATNLERTLVRKSDQFSKEKEQRNITWQQVQDALRKDEAAIEFITYRPWSNEFKDTTVYAALLLRKDAKRPAFIPLFREHELSPLLAKSDDNSDLSHINELYSRQGKGRALYELIWSKLKPALENVETIYYSPSGLLHQLSLKALPHPTAPFLSHQHKLVRLNSTRKLVVGTSQPALTSATMFGGVKYAYKADTGTEQQKGESYLAMNSVPGHKQTRAIRGNFEFLEGSLKEVTTISDIVSGQASTKMKTGYGATERAFKKMDGNSPELLHISTHGFFFPDDPDSARRKGARGSGEPTFSYLDDPLFRSGLAFAGGNYTWKNGYNPFEKEDGILTAREISNMNLANTDLAVLSACETGLGEIKGSEGVYGLQRAFKMAGVDYLIMSLWQVPDEETMVLMKTFYKNWLNGQPIREAFRNAQQKLAEDYPPYFWASFVMVGGGKVDAASAPASWWLGEWMWLMAGIGIVVIGSGVAIWWVRRSGSQA